MGYRNKERSEVSYFTRWLPSCLLELLVPGGTYSELRTKLLCLPPLVLRGWAISPESGGQSEGPTVSESSFFTLSIIAHGSGWDRSFGTGTLSNHFSTGRESVV